MARTLQDTIKAELARRDWLLLVAHQRIEDLTEQNAQLTAKLAQPATAGATTTSSFPQRVSQAS